MEEPMDTQRYFCPCCKRDVSFAATRAPGHLGQANLTEDSPEPVCLDYGACCTDSVCALTGEALIVMGFRLARSGLREDPPQVVTAYCPECDEQRELDVLSPAHGYCPVCNSTVALLQHRVVPTGPN
jgi:hypothetical protein